MYLFSPLLKLSIYMFGLSFSGNLSLSCGRLHADNWMLLQIYSLYFFPFLTSALFAYQIGLWAFLSISFYHSQIPLMATSLAMSILSLWFTYSDALCLQLWPYPSANTLSTTSICGLHYKGRTINKVLVDVLFLLITNGYSEKNLRPVQTLYKSKPGLGSINGGSPCSRGSEWVALA